MRYRYNGLTIHPNEEECMIDIARYLQLGFCYNDTRRFSQVFR